MDPQHVSSYGGPRVMLPASDAERFIRQMDSEGDSKTGLYASVCAISDFCGVVSPWGTPILVFGDTPDDIYYSTDDGHWFFRWVAAPDFETLHRVASRVRAEGQWTEHVDFEIESSSQILMDSCALIDDDEPRIHLEIPAGRYTASTVYIEDDEVEVWTTVTDIKKRG